MAVAIKAHRRHRHQSNARHCTDWPAAQAGRTGSRSWAWRCRPRSANRHQSNARHCTGWPPAQAGRTGSRSWRWSWSWSWPWPWAGAGAGQVRGMVKIVAIKSHRRHRHQSNAKHCTGCPAVQTGRTGSRPWAGAGRGLALALALAVVMGWCWGWPWPWAHRAAPGQGQGRGAGRGRYAAPEQRQALHGLPSSSHRPHRVKAVALDVAKTCGLIARPDAPRRAARHEAHAVPRSNQAP